MYSFSRIVLIWFLALLFAVTAHAGITAKEIFSPRTEVYDITSDSPDLPAVEQIEVEKVKRQVEVVMGLFPRSPQIESCIDYGDGRLGCPIDSVACSIEGEEAYCPNGGKLNGERDMCQLDPDVKCPPGYTWDRSIDRCVNGNVCSDGGVLNPSLDRCEKIAVNECPHGYTYDGRRDVCWKRVNCSVGVFNPERDRCEASVSCPTGYSYVASVDRCEKSPVCPSGTTYSIAHDKCMVTFIKGCAPGYSYVASVDRCEKSPVCPSGTTYNGTTNRCEGGSSCPLGSFYNYSTGKCDTQKVKLAIGRVGDNYLQGYCRIVTYRTKLNIKDVRAVKSFLLKQTIFDDYIMVKVNGHVVRVGPYGGDRLQIVVVDPSGRIWKNNDLYDCNRNQFYSYCEMKVQYSSSATGYCELGKSWRQYHEIDVRPYLKNGINTFEITVEVAGNGEAYAYFEAQGAGMSCAGEYCSATNSGSYSSGTKCPSGQYNLNGLCVANPICGGGSFDGGVDRCYTSYNKECPSGTTYSSSLNMCVASPDCGNGMLDTSRNTCYAARATICPTGSMLDKSADICYSSPVCDSGVYDAPSNECRASITRECGANYSWSAAARKCIASPTCPRDASFSLASTIEYSVEIDKCISKTIHECAGDYAYNGLPIIKCELVPICVNGIYDPAMNGCYTGDKCPIDSAIACIGPAKNSWCSPHPCNAQGLCGVARCLQGVASNDSPIMERSKYFPVEPGSGASGVCRDQVCDLVAYKDVSYCGKTGCPEGFGVYEENGRCYKDVCPEGSYEFDGRCYKEGCPSGYILSGEGTCVPE